MFLCWVNCYSINGYTVSYPTPGHRFLAMAQSSGYCIGCIFPNFEAWAVLHGLIYGKVQPWWDPRGWWDPLLWTIAGNHGTRDTFGARDTDGDTNPTYTA